MSTALLSVWDKTGIVALARSLHQLGIDILSSGGTGRALAEAGVPFTEVSAYTGSPEMMDGRVKTLHPKIHGGLLGRRGIDDAIMEQHKIPAIDLLVVNLYPFEAMSAQNLPIEELVEFIDIGGPAMIRAAAKNYKDVAVICDPTDYPAITDALQKGGVPDSVRLSLAKKAFARTAAYDAAISNHLNSLDSTFPSVLTVQFESGRKLRYGENPHQQAAVYGTVGIAGVEPLQGKQMSYNNYLDLNSAVGLLREFDDPACVIVKHNNPCGVATGKQPIDAYIRARDVDPVSAYGSVVALNREVGSDVAEAICSTFVEVIIAPSFSAEALEMMKAKENMRVLIMPEPSLADELRSIDGGILCMRTPPYLEHWEVVSEREPTSAELEAMRLAWRVCKHTKSNTIIFANNEETLGIGAGQMSRVDAAKIAIEKSNKSLKGSVIASDAFLPFPDTLEVAADAGATALIQPGGSIRDAEVIEAANKRNMAMIFTGVRYFRH
ncbi:bifunctional phosphoribosylaminoimidazolecarboxamide formyltransferase/IMP cyclohydrolase [Methanocalculus taiwanensis]|uniref:Bifunctional phosphoribosylaminoimidazolecarboxamide formyltransferase/IMP cyclohydrolase n=1 Tax=Methanocalculus taiwanensis TaxID=106207 RepID=A0ABD4TGR4_9EURY|nr:bifunctional phosphoribosylaminoimidazolecarboxamide formyltransferase/IMP cyclohydrolase [Methanocalculus taiwanensis]MCQ1537871.1 bifunctional phosphoribosylaminoimidazolecarboxamide formyltransferase/IMP cyclohydrolase [Methanocalculus taiwanensis]